MTESNGAVNMSMPVAPAYGGYGGNGFGGDWGSWIILFLIFGMFGNGWGGNGGFGGGMGLYPWLNNSNQMNDGFQNQMLNTQLMGIQTAVTNGFGNAEVAACNRAMNDLERSFASQTAITQGMNGIAMNQQNGIFENRLGIANLGSDIAREACATRTYDTQNTQAVLNAINDGFRQMSDQRYLDKIDAKNDEIAQLRQEVLFARGQASQIAQNSQIIDGIYNRLDTCPVGTTPVYGRTPIFNCNGNGFGCSGNTFFN